MAIAAIRRAGTASDLLKNGADAVGAVEALLAEATAGQRARFASGGRLSVAQLEREQHAVHGLAWLATYVEALRQLLAHGSRLADGAALGPTDELLVRAGLGEFLAQIFGGIPMSQSEFVRLPALGLPRSGSRRGAPRP